MRDIFAYLENAAGEEMHAIADKMPELSDAQVNKLLKMSEKKYRKRKRSPAADGCEAEAQHAGGYAPSLWHRGFVTAAACLVAAAGLAGIAQLMKHAPLDEGAVNVPYEMPAATGTLTSADTAVLSADVTDAVYSRTTVTETSAASSAASADETTVQETTAAPAAASVQETEWQESEAQPSAETLPVQEDEPQLTEPQFPAEETSTETVLPVTTVGIYSSRSGIIALYADGTGTIAFQDSVPIRWNAHELIGEDFTFPYTISGDTIIVDVDGMERSFTKGGEMPQSDVNPIVNHVGRYAGTYPVDRATMRVEALDDNGVKVTISWGSSVSTEAVFTMSGECRADGENILVSYQNSTRRFVEYNSDGTVVSETTEYTDGTGTLIFKENTVQWDDDTENADEVMLFEYLTALD